MRRFARKGNGTLFQDDEGTPPPESDATTKYSQQDGGDFVFSKPPEVGGSAAVVGTTTSSSSSSSVATSGGGGGMRSPGKVVGSSNGKTLKIGRNVRFRGDVMECESVVLCGRLEVKDEIDHVMTGRCYGVRSLGRLCFVCMCESGALRVFGVEECFVGTTSVCVRFPKYASVLAYVIGHVLFCCVDGRHSYRLQVPMMNFVLLKPAHSPHLPPSKFKLGSFGARGKEHGILISGCLWSFEFCRRPQVFLGGGRQSCVA